MTPPPVGIRGTRLQIILPLVSAQPTVRKHARQQGLTANNYVGNYNNIFIGERFLANISFPPGHSSESIESK